MEIVSHKIGNFSVAEIVSSEILIIDLESALQLMVDCYYQEFDAIVLSADNLIPEFFDLKTRFAGEVLQKFSNYKMRLMIVGDFSDMGSDSLRDFIFESNKGRTVNFVASRADAISIIGTWV